MEEQETPNMIHFYKVTVTHNNETVQVYPQRPGPDELPNPGIDIEEACQRIGTMVMSAGITSINVYRDDELYRSVVVTEHAVQSGRGWQPREQ
jgi:hypothetical protein